MTAPILLVHDDIAAIATLRRLLSRQGHEVVLATTVADAITSFSHHRPKLILVAPGVEDNRGASFLEELAATPEGPSTPLLLLGDGLSGVDAMVVPVPVQSESLREKVEEAMAHEPVWAFSGSVPLDLAPDISTDETMLPPPSLTEAGLTEETPVTSDGRQGTTEEIPVELDDDVEEKARALEVEEGEARARAARLARSAGAAKEAVSRAVRLAQMLQKKQEEERALAEQAQPSTLEDEPASVAVEPEKVVEEVPPPVLVTAVPEKVEAPPVVLVSPVISAEPVIPQEEASSVISLPTAAAPSIEVPLGDLKEFDAVYERFQNVDYFGVLGVSRSAQMDDIRKAFEALSKAYHPLKYVAHPDAALRRRVGQIHELLNEAFSALSVDGLRQAYASNLPP